MQRTPRWTIAVALSALGAAAVFVMGGSPPSRLSASTVAPFADSDSDGLPDQLEQVLLTQPLMVDSDSDGADDFLEAATYELPQNPPPTVRPLDNDARAMVAVHTDASGRSHVVLHMLFRLASSASQVRAVLPFIDFQGIRYPISDLVARNVVYSRVLSRPGQGLYLLLSSRIADPSEFKVLLPCSVGMTAVIDQKTIETGTLIVNESGTPSAVVPVRTGYFVVQPLIAPTGSGSGGGGGFWTQAHVCELELIPLGAGGGVQLCQVGDADCKGEPTLQCAPSCSSWQGRMFVVPFGLRFLNGQ